MRMALTRFLSSIVLLIATPVGQTDDLLGAVVDSIGNVKKVTDLIKEDFLPFCTLMFLRTMMSR
jgi:hypothetical protein